MTAPRVLFVSSAHPAFDKRVFEREGKTLASAGYDVIHLTPDLRDEMAAQQGRESVRILTYKRQSGLLGRLFALPRLIRTVYSVAPDVIHCNEVDSWCAGLVAGRLLGAPVVFDVHEHYPSTFASSHMPPLLRGLAALTIRALFRILTPFTDRVVLAKPSVAEDFPLRENQGVLVRNFPPLRLACKVSDEPEPSAASLVAVHIGLLNRSRGWPQLLEALSRLGERIQLRIIGEIHDTSGPGFREMVHELDLESRVRVEEWLPLDQAFKELLSTDVGLILFQPGIVNHTFASPHKLYEYMLAGLPVIAPEFAVEIAAVVRKHECGILVDPSCPRSIADALERLSADPELGRGMGERGRAAVIKELNWETESVRLIEMYRELIGPAVREVPRPRDAEH